MRNWLLAVLAIALLVEASSFSAFQHSSGSGGVGSGGGFLVIAKENYASARVDIQILPTSNSSLGEVTRVGFPNGTTKTLTSELDFQLELQGTISLPAHWFFFGTCGLAQAVRVTYQKPVNASILPYSSLFRVCLMGAPTSTTSYYILNVTGQAGISYEMWTVTI
ncbi:MAG: hypothetical protein ABSB53_07470 [Nitrososphaerales archaeon]|jgi:hypothetical protein